MIRRSHLSSFICVLIGVIACGGKTRSNHDDSVDGNWGGLGGAAATGGSVQGSGGAGTGAEPGLGGRGPGTGGTGPSSGGVGASSGGPTGGQSGMGASTSDGGSPGGVFPCIGAYYDTDPDPDRYKCHAWTTCEPGTRVTRGGTLSQDRECAPCEEGTFTVSNNLTNCTQWRPCLYGLAVSRAGTSSSDVECGPGEHAFSAIAYEHHQDGPAMTVSSEGIYASVGPDTVLRLSFDGKDRSTWSIDMDPSETIKALSGLEDAVYVVTTSHQAYPTRRLPHGFLAKYDSTGNELWRRAFPDFVGTTLRALLKSDGENLYVIRTLQPCQVLGCAPEDDTQLVLSSYDTEGELLWEEVHELRGSLAPLLGATVADDFIHVVVPYYYGSALRRYDLSGQLVDEVLAFEQNDLWFQAIEPDPRGGVMLYDPPNRLYRVVMDQPPELIEIEGGSDDSTVLLPQADELLFAGTTSYNDGDVLLTRSDRDGGFLDRTDAGAPGGDRATHLMRLPSGQVVVGGLLESEKYLFIHPWPR